MISTATRTLTIALLLAGSSNTASSFSAPLTLSKHGQRSFVSPWKINSRSCKRNICSWGLWSSNTDEDNDVEPDLGTNWIGASESVGGKPLETKSETVPLDLGIDGEAFGIGPLSEQMHNALLSVAAKRGSDIPAELKDVYLLYAMDASAKEVVKAAMDDNGFVMNLGDDPDMQDEGKWGQIENIMLIDPKTGKATQDADGENILYNSWSDVISRGKWEPGQAFSFVVRNVPSRVKGMDLAALLKSMDPDGSLAMEAKERGILMPDEDIESLADLAADCGQRVRSAPQGPSDEKDVFSGDDDKGYNIISRSSMMKENRNQDGTENLQTLLHVMDALANHGCLIVDLTDGDELPEEALKMSKMWETTASLFEKAGTDEDVIKNLPPMQEADGVGSSHATVGFLSVNDGDQQFLETRIRRSDGTLLPEGVHSVIGQDGVQSMVDAFNIMAEVGKDIVRIATAAASDEAKAFVSVGSVVSDEEKGSPSIAGLTFEEASASGIWEDGDNSDRRASEEDITRSKILSSDAAMLLTEEIMDDGKPLLNQDFENNEGTVSMSPHRMCRYSNNKESKEKSNAREIFGAHTDTSFVTIVPAASVSGLEVFDEDALEWYRPELRALKDAKQLDPKRKMDSQFPWHCRYLIVMPGELLQITSRNNIPAVVHRVVATNEKPRLSAPVLLRARPGTKMDVERYMGSLDKADDLLQSCNGMNMEEIHNALQAVPTQQ